MGTKAENHAHRRLYFAVISFIGAEQHGSQMGVRATAIEFEAAKRESEQIIFPKRSRNETT